MAPVCASIATRCPALVVTNSRSRAPPVVATPVIKTGAPSAIAGSVTWNVRVSCATFPAVMEASLVLFPLWDGSPLNWSQS